MLKPLNSRQQQVFDAILDHYAEHGTPPSIPEVAKREGGNRHNVYRHIKNLTAKGWLENVDGLFIPVYWRELAAVTVQSIRRKIRVTPKLEN